MFLYDFKHDDAASHRNLTGCSNELIKANLVKLSQTGKPIEIRMPLIPGLNTTPATLAAAGAFLSRINHNITVVRLLRYHALAHTKYVAVGRTDTMPDVPPPDHRLLEAAAEILRSYGLNVM